MGARRPIDYLGSIRSRRPTPLPRAGRRSVPCSFCPGVLGRSCVGAGRSLRCLGGRALVLLRGEIQHKNLWLIDLETGAERQLTNLTSGFDIRDFDISPDGREVVLERAQEHSYVMLPSFKDKYSAVWRDVAVLYFVKIG